MSENAKQETANGGSALVLLALLSAIALGCAAAVPAGSVPEPTPAASPTPSDPRSTSSTGASSPPSAPAPRRTTESWAQLVKEGRGHLQRRELAEAEDRFLRAYDLTRDFRPGDPRTNTSVPNLQRLASAFLRAGSSASFARMMELLIHIGSEVPAARNPELARLLQRLASMRILQERPAEARDALELTLAILKEAKGVESGALVGVHSQLGLSLIELGELEAAEIHIDRAAEIGEAVSGKGSALYATSLVPRAKLELARGNVDEAREALLAAVALNEQQHGENNPATARVVRELAIFEQTAGDYSAAEKSFDRMIAIWDSLPNESYQHAQSRNELAWFLVETGQAKQAEAPARSAFGLLEEKGTGGQALAAIADTLATALRDQGKYEEAERLYQSALLEGAKAEGLPGWELLPIAERYAVLLEETGRSAEAEDVRSRWQKTTLGTSPLEGDAP